MQYSDILERLRTLSNPRAIQGMAKYGITPEKTYGVSIPNLRKFAKEIGTDHKLTQQLWASGIRETQILASMIDASEMVTETQMGSWVKDFDCLGRLKCSCPIYWAILPDESGNYQNKTEFAYQKAVEWSSNDKEFIKRARFVLMARLAFKDKKSEDRQFEKFLTIIKREASDSRNFVRKAVNWALRQIGKRNLSLNQMAVEAAREIQRIDSRSARWVASDAIQELTSKAIQERLRD